jgi:hypothetical protein
VPRMAGCPTGPVLVWLTFYLSPPDVAIFVLAILAIVANSAVPVKNCKAPLSVGPTDAGTPPPDSLFEFDHEMYFYRYCFSC